MAQRGRPSTYSEEIAAKICSRIATSSDSLRKICAEDGMPNPDTLYLWLIKHPEFSEQYARARKDQAQLLADEIVDIADSEKIGEIVTIKADGTEERKIADMIEHRKMQIEARKWVASKLLPKKYGDKVQQEITGADGGPVQASISVQFVKPK